MPEEMLARGILIVGGRDAGWSELVVVLVSCALFGLLHGINAFFGQSLQTTVQQIVFATVMGASFYAIRMSTGTLVVCMLRRAAVAGPILEGEPLRVDTSVSGAVSRVVALVRERARRDGWRDRD
jgi:membrane protease YdiL (CAAX protease family)